MLVMPPIVTAEVLVDLPIVKPVTLDEMLKSVMGKLNAEEKLVP